MKITNLEKINKGKNKKRRVYKPTDNQHLEFVLNKTNFDTLSAINYIGKIVHKPISFFGIAGTKVCIYVII